MRAFENARMHTIEFRKAFFLRESWIILGWPSAPAAAFGSRQLVCALPLVLRQPQCDVVIFPGAFGTGSGSEGSSASAISLFEKPGKTGALSSQPLLLSHLLFQPAPQRGDLVRGLAVRIKLSHGLSANDCPREGLSVADRNGATG